MLVTIAMEKNNASKDGGKFAIGKETIASS